MLDYFIEAGSRIIDVCGYLTHQQWLMVFLGAVVVGLLCLRGFGSRANY